MSDDKADAAGNAADGGVIAYGERAGHVYDWILSRILATTLPPGSFIDKTAIAAEIGVSKQPVTVALARLAREGWVEIESRVGSYVARIDADVLRDVTEVWFAACALLAQDIRLVLHAGDAERIRAERDAVATAFAEGRYNAALEGLRDVETFILERIGNEKARGYQLLFSAHMDRYNRHIETSRVARGVVEEGRRAFIAAGLARLDAIERGDIEAALQSCARQKALCLEHIARITTDFT